MNRLTRAAIVGGMTLALGGGTALAAPSGAAWTTNADGSAVNANHYAASTDVYLNGGPPCNASRRSAALPDGWYAFKVTDPSGRTDMTAAEPVAERMFRVAGGAVAESSDAVDHPINATACGAVMRVGPFAASSANGQYKLHVVPVAKGGQPVFSPSATKTDNFSLAKAGTPSFEPPPFDPPVDPTPVDPPEDTPPVKAFSLPGTPTLLISTFAAPSQQGARTPATSAAATSPPGATAKAKATVKATAKAKAKAQSAAKAAATAKAKAKAAKKARARR